MVAGRVISEVIEQIYDAGVDEQNWLPAMESVRSIIGAETFHLHLRDESQGIVRSLATSFSETFQAKYAEHWWRFDIRVKAMKEAAIGIPHICSNLVNVSDYLRSPIYNELARAEGGAVHMVAGVLPFAANEHALLGLHRNKDAPDFTPEDAQLLQLLTPHIVKSLKLRSLTNKIQGVLDAAAAFELFQDALFVVDEKSRLMKTNSAGEALLARGDVLQWKRSGVLLTGRPATTEQLHHLVRAAATNFTLGGGQSAEDGSIPVQAEDGSVVAVVVSRLPQQKTVFGAAPSNSVLLTVRDPRRRATAPAALLRKLHGLTETEAAIATDLANGLSLDEISAARSVRISTVRWHLKSIFSKTGVARQSELARLLTGYH